MKHNLRLGEGGSIRDGWTGEGRPAWNWVDGMPDGQKALLQSQGNPNNRWTITRTPPVEADKERTFATREEALEELQKEVG